MTVKEVCALKKKSRKTVYHWINHGFKPRGKDPVRLYAEPMGNDWNISKENLDDFLYKARKKQ